MSFLLSATASHASKTIKLQTFRLLHRPIAMAQSLKERFCLNNSLQHFKVPRPIVRFNCSRAYDVNTNVTKDIILFKYENPKYFKMLNFFGIFQFIFWTYLSHFAFTKLKDAPVDEASLEDLAWYQRINLGENKYRNGITTVCFLIGYGILVAAWMFSLRSVRFLILRKGGRDISIVTYGPFNNNRIMTVPLINVSAQESRQAAKSQLPLKVKNRTLFYVLDMRGEFKNPQLFDYTAGLKRRL